MPFAVRSVKRTANPTSAPSSTGVEVLRRRVEDTAPDFFAELEALGIGTAYFSMGDDDLSGLPDVDYVFHCGANVDPKTPEIGITQNAEGMRFIDHKEQIVCLSCCSKFGKRRDIFGLAVLTCTATTCIRE